MEHVEGPCVMGYEQYPELVDSRGRIINGVGPGDTDLPFLGGTPGAEGDEGGELLVGRSGSMSDDALRKTGLACADVRITNCVRCRPPGNRDPTSNELSNCQGYPAHEFEFVDPELVVTLGKVSSQHLLDRGVAIANESGSVMDARAGDTSYRVLLSIHPAATLYDRDQREGFFKIIAHVIGLLGLADSTDGQTSLGDF